MLHEKKLSCVTDVICDVDKTLTESKADLTEAMGDLLKQITEHCRLALISGCKFEQFQWQVLPQLKRSGVNFARVTLLPTSGGAMYVHEDRDWQQIYYHGLSDEQNLQIEAAIWKAVTAANEELDLNIPEEPYGMQIEFRGSQVTFSALGQEAPPGPIKDEWDPAPEKAKRSLILKHLAPLLPSGIEASYGGSTSLDVVVQGIHKGYGIKKYVEHHPELANISSMVFIGDALEEGGNDYPARETGIDCIAVDGPEDTKKVLSSILAAQ